MSLKYKTMADAIRILAIDAIQNANSGHPGMPMGMADIAVALWNFHLKHNPKNPNWINRDRFVLSNGHGSMLLYALLHLTGYDLPIDELRNFRKLNSRTPGHPEYRITPGVECTTGPLGQGLANAVGMALAEKLLSQEFNKPSFEIIDHRTYVFVGDGCLMEGISHEVCSLAGTLKLNKLIAFWDNNGISIDGKVDHWFNEDIVKRFESYNWNVIANIDGHNVENISDSIILAKKSIDKPTLICCKTTIGYGSPNFSGTEKIHGSPLGEQESIQTKAALDWDHPSFIIPEAVYEVWDATEAGRKRELDWKENFCSYSKVYSAEACEIERRINGDLSKEFNFVLENHLSSCIKKMETIATRQASQNTIQALAPAVPEFLGGSADLTPSNLTNWKISKPIRKNKWGNYINYGVREFGMSAIMNGIALHSGYIPFGGTFLAFSDYSKSALRMAALMKIRSIFIFTHDSIGLGEDGPTHQAIEQITSLRLIPNMHIWRPCDTIETAIAWSDAVMRKDGPTCLIFTRQNCPFVNRNTEQILNIKKGGYILRDTEQAQAIIIATGSEVMIALDAERKLKEKSINVRVVSLPSTTVFDQQSEEYKTFVLPRNIPKIAIEAGSTNYWWKYNCIAVHGIDTFGESAPADILYQHFELTAEAIIKSICEHIK